MKKKNLLMTTLATLSASGALLTTGASALADSYTVVKNDTLWGLSKKYGVSVSDLKKANGVSGHLIYVGQKLQIPTKSTKTAKTSTSTSTVDTTSTTHTVVKGDTLWSLAKKYGVSVSALMKANNLSSSTILIGQSLNLRAGMTTYGVNGVTTGSSSTAASANTASSTSTTASSQAPKDKKTTTKAKSTTTNTSSNSNTSTSANTQSQSTASNSSASTTTNTNTVASNANTTSSTNTAASSSQAVSQAPTASTSTASASASAITSYALTFLGVPYVWGGTTPSGFDCSGLVQYVYSHFGINLGRTTYTQQYAGTKISVASAQAGDLYFWGSYGSAYHVAIALGGGQYVMAPAPGQNVMTGSVSSYTPSFAVRVLG
ncbi:LysM peptidoglycan-binding domain-containing protein [Lactobacillus delbrueckii subsp. bulgaricus]|nr:hydrolase [Lactobacillus delbrueckii subsp. bulgaricus]MBT8896596.1 hydrolase [Lactobacillus delbrueckii subsp. bulgaricus]MBT8897973.1 hydrolase [Lactobacillus delbrueckii subsp. bulgaricus]MBT8903146.1 hydrolase [Lactobacillus delbrueckii subsp. bulgaricus]MBT8905737.1 hydrolase [Lactobacillus delbrueckii subsp. bulgaricus]